MILKLRSLRFTEGPSRRFGSGAGLRLRAHPAQTAQKARAAIGIDTSSSSLLLRRAMLPGISNCDLLNVKASQLAFRDHIFDLVVCIQNGISAFHANQKELHGSVRAEAPPKTGVS